MSAAVVIAIVLVIAGAFYIRVAWHRSPLAYRAMIALSAGYFLAGALAATWALHTAAPKPLAPPAQIVAPSTGPTSTTPPTLKENNTGPTFPRPLLHYDPTHALLPDPKLTPGDTLPGVTAADVCTPGWSREHRHVTEGMRDKAYAEYGRTRKPGCCEVDHLVPLELGGSNEMKNLWPEPDDPRPGDAEKDSLENDLHERVCNGEMSLADAQKCIASNWVECWEKYVVPEYGSQWTATNRHGW